MSARMKPSTVFDKRGGEWTVAQDATSSLGRGEHWVKAIAVIYDNTTREMREYPTREILKAGKDAEDHPSAFNWAENNYACDCNRRLFFQRAGGVELLYFDPETPCTEGQFSVCLLNARDRKTYYVEDGMAERMLRKEMDKEIVSAASQSQGGRL